jgi:hypothetical protein
LQSRARCSTPRLAQDEAEALVAQMNVGADSEPVQVVRKARVRLDGLGG